MPLFDAFIVCGLSASEPICTVQGDIGYCGPFARYKPVLTDFLSKEGGTKLPPHLPTLVLPGGVEILSADCADPSPRVYSVVLTGERLR